ncbi:protein atonal homolog 8 [Notolabrus celidotus]|uniref:protein atonal homolog 8 n=1 Tax=Notolabrus celidotus TaxID=1203425 RepID=UPI00148FBAA0|nr:protein atonal homolog 8 [Notolabrus celidotus]XP_034545207.1 protein atonal homolog 8 [Notolabrus celidotus]
MKNPHQLTNTWTRSISKDPVLVSNKKFKRKSREPKRLFSEPHPDRTRAFPADGSDVDSADEGGPISRLGPPQRQLMDAGSRSAGMVSEGGIPSAHSGALDMRIGFNVPSITSRLTQAPPSPLPEISHWPPTISQPLTHRLRLSRSTLPPSIPTTSSLSMEPPLAGLLAVPPGSRTSQNPLSQEHLEPQVQPPQDSPRNRAGLCDDDPGLGLGPGPAPGRVPEVKAIQQTRRLLANARERTRVHTISAAFEALRKQVPCYSYGQKLSKLAILRIACNYILSLAQLAELDYSPDHDSVSFSQCVEQCTRTLQAEGRSKKRKE